MGDILSELRGGGGSKTPTPSFSAPKSVGGGSPSLTIPGVKSPTAKEFNALRNFTNNWSTRLQQFSQVKGIDLKKHVAPVYNMDLQRVQKGQKAFTNAQVVDFVKTVQQGKPLVAPESSGHHGLFGWVGNTADDIASVVSGLNPINLVHELYKGGMGGLAAGARLVGDVGGLDANKSGKNTDVTNAINDVLGHIPGYTGAAHSVDKAIGDITREQIKKGNTGLKSLNPLSGSGTAVGEGMQSIRGINLVPGTYTASNLLLGKPGELYKHPGFTALDLLPYAGKIGEAAAGLKFGDAVETAGKEGSVIPKGTAWESLAEGNPVKAATRRAGITGVDSISERLAKQYGVSADVRDVVRRWSQTAREGPLYQRYQTLKDAYHNAQHVAEDRLNKVQARIAQAEKEGRPVHPLLKQAEAIAMDKVEEARSNVRRIASADTVEFMWHNHSTPEQAIRDKLESSGFTPAQIDREVKNNWTNLAKWSGKWKINADFKKIITQDGAETGFNEAMVPKYMTKALDKLNQTHLDNALGKGYRGLTNLFRFSVLLGPRHAVHVLFSNGMFMALDDLENFRPSVIQRAFDAALHPENWPSGLQRGVGTFSKNVSDELVKQSKGSIEQELAYTKTETIHQIAQGRTWGRLVKEALTEHGPLGWLRKFEEMTTNMSRAMVYFNEVDHYLANDAGVSEAKDLMGKGVKNTATLGKAMKAANPAAHEAGLQAAIKVLMDLDGMSPIERTVVRQVIPFYPFTRQLLTYMARFPAEHPVKAAVLAAVGRMEMEDGQSGLPMKFMSMFPITGTDSSGNAIFIDTKNMNPFRSMNGLAPWTLAGFLSELNPLITAPMQAAGINILTATPELYPQLTVDRVSGDLVAKHTGVAQTLLGAIVPETNTIASLTGLSQQYASLQQSDPTAYRQLLLSNLNLPFVPASKNLSQERIRYAKNLFQVAQQDVKAGNLNDYSVVPYAGGLYTVSQLKAALKAAGK